MSTRRVKPPASPGTGEWFEREIRRDIEGGGIYRAARADTLGRLEVLGFTRLEERLAEWCTARHLVLRIADGQVEVRPIPKPQQAPKISLSMLEVITRGLF